MVSATCSGYDPLSLVTVEMKRESDQAGGTFHFQSNYVAHFGTSTLLPKRAVVEFQGRSNMKNLGFMFANFLLVLCGGIQPRACFISIQLFGCLNGLLYKS